jgi:hypothetical protein
MKTKEPSESCTDILYFAPFLTIIAVILIHREEVTSQFIGALAGIAAVLAIIFPWLFGIKSNWSSDSN